MVYADAPRLWPGGKVPYVHASKNNLRAIRTIERATCIRFFPWSQTGNKTTNDELGLDHQSYVDFVYEGGCWADQGNKRHGRQKVSCCGGYVCVHELSHALGAYHEQQNPLGKGRIRLNPYNTETSKAYNFRPIAQSELDKNMVYSNGYDMTSVMAYPRGQFGNGKGSPIDYMFSDLFGGHEWYYLMQEISHVHKCDELYCSHFTMKCVNDGYLTLVENVCACKCPDGLDPDTGCATPIKDLEAEKWPVGTYGLPKTKEGCTNDTIFKSGTVIHTGTAPTSCADENPRACKYWLGVYGCLDNPNFMNSKCPVTCNVCDHFGNYVSDHYALSGYTNGDQVEDDFCVKTNTAVDDPNIKWVGGQYCIYRKNGKCPDGLDGGSVTFTDEQHSNASNAKSGETVDGEFTHTTTLYEYCCSRYGFEWEEIVLPRTKPFALFKGRDADSCHKVRGMHVYEGFTVVKNKGGEPTIDGDTPVISWDKSKDEWGIYYCYYIPALKDCGDTIHLTPSNPEVTFETSQGKETICDWMITAPANSRILLNFEEFNVSADHNGDCIDKVNIRYDRPGQPGVEFCGDTFQRSITSVNNTLRITFETFRYMQHPGMGESHIKGKLTLIDEHNLCYTKDNKGLGYAGPVNYTRGMKACIPWVEAAHCVHSPFQVKEMLHSLTDNHCRNPDLEDGFRPWCYTDSVQCYRDYCDVCLFENLYDTNKECESLAQLGFCENDPGAFDLCARTCQQYVPSLQKPKLAKDVSCAAPGPVSDGDVVGHTKSSYAIGETVTYQCNNHSQHTTKTRTCLSTGLWSSLNYVCSECESDWLYWQGNCYQMSDDLKNLPAAVAACKAKKAQLVTAKNKDIADFLTSLDYWKGTWLNGHDDAVEGTWRWADDNTIFNYTNWAYGQPDNYGNEDCLWMQADGEFEDRWCTRDYDNYVCYKPPYAVTGCDDVTDDCANFYKNNATVCSTQSQFMSINCKKTCGLCASLATCTVEVATSNAQKSQATDVRGIDQGQYVKYECKPGFTRLSGDAVRGCLPDGRMSGQPLVCRPNDVVTSTAKLEKEGSWSSTIAQAIITGDYPGFVIPKNGKIVRWEFVSTAKGEAAFQVWRNSTGDQSKLELVGQNLLTTPGELVTTYYVPVSEQIAVQKGDFIGIWTGKISGVGFTTCDENDHHGNWTNLRVSKDWIYDVTTFTPSSSLSFIVETHSICRVYRWRAVIE